MLSSERIVSPMSTVTVNGKTIEAAVGETIEDTVRNSGFNPDAFLFVLDGKPVPMDSPIEDGWNVRAIKVASGG